MSRTSPGLFFLVAALSPAAVASDVRYRGDRAEFTVAAVGERTVQIVLTPFDGSPVRGRIPSGSCVPALPHPLPAGQLLRHVDWDEVLARDAKGTPRDRGLPCDIGAVQSPPRPAEPPPTARAAARAGSSDQRPDTGDRTPQRTNAIAHVGAPAGSAQSAQPRLVVLARQLGRLDASARRFDELLACTTELPVDQAGDVRHRWGFRYDERDGTGIDKRTALVRHQGGGRPDLRLLRLARTRRCLSAAHSSVASRGA